MSDELDFAVVERNINMHLIAVSINLSPELVTICEFIDDETILLC